MKIAAGRKEDPSDFSVTYSIQEILRRATKKLKIHDRGIPLTSDVFGRFPTLVGRLRRFGKWNRDGVSHVKVFYDPNYYHRNAHTVHLMDPIHIYAVLKYAGIK